jgi:septal ring factor EnvC (AmiA/AmiB activator)
MIAKRLGGAVGSFNDMVLKDTAGVPLKTGCDGEYGSTMVKVTNAFCVKYGLPQTANGLVTDALMGKLNQALMDLQTGSGVTQEEYNQKVAELAAAEAQLAAAEKENTELKYQISQQNEQILRLQAQVNTLKQQLADMSIELAKANVKVKAYDELTGALATVKKHTP